MRNIYKFYRFNKLNADERNRKLEKILLAIVCLGAGFLIGITLALSLIGNNTIRL